MQLCDRDASSSYGAAQCHWVHSCQGATQGYGEADYCYPYVLWSSRRVSNLKAWSPELLGGSFFENYGDAGHPVTQAISVRCVLVLISGYYGLQLCDSQASSSYGAARCYYLAGGCQGAALNTNWANKCYPYHLWSGTPSGAEYWSPNLNAGSINLTGACGTGHCPVSLTFSVRCVLDLIPFSIQTISSATES